MLNGSSNGISPLVYIGIIIAGIEFFVIIGAFVKRYTETGYNLLIASLVLDGLYIVAVGFGTSVYAGLFFCVSVILLFIVNMIYLTKRKALFGMDNNPNNDLSDKSVTNEAIKGKQPTKENAADVLIQAMQKANERALEIGPIILEGQRPEQDDYGLCETNPICVFSLNGTEEYLKRLCTKDGRTFTWSSYTMISASLHGLKDVGEDKYTLYLDGKPYAELFFVLYYGQTEFPPAGLYFIDDERDWDLEREALRKDITPEQLLELRRIDGENKQLKLLLENKFFRREDEINIDYTDRKLFCRKCGAQLPIGSVFCNKCGTKVIEK